LGPEKKFNNTGKINQKPIRNSMLKKNLFRLSVNLEAINYLAGLADDVNGINVLNAARDCGRIFSDVKKLQAKDALLGGDMLKKDEINTKLDNINQLINALPSVSELWDRYALDDPKNKFCNLITRVRQRASMTQRHLIRIQNLAISEIKKKISSETDTETKLALIDKLNILQDSKIREQMHDWKISEILNDEKPSKHFLDIARKGKSGSDINDIRDDAGNAFDSKEELNEHIRCFYKNLYEKKNTVGTIEDFLGPEICNSELIKNSKLTEDEKDNLDKDLTLNELDESLRRSNFKSAPGRDGFSNCFIREFWHIFRKPLYDVAKHGLNNADLPDFFMSADIKLIPKKDDGSSIKNWRPISLLSNFYKIISRAINNRLKKIAPRILSRAQKGFVPGKYMHEVIINTEERLNYCKKNNINGFLVSADLTKAFDSVSHEFMSKCYEFYNFGPRIKKWLGAIGTGRTASIITGEGEYTDKFELGTGHAQGDSPSPLLFNFAQQICLFKIELDPEIERIRLEPQLPKVYESNRYAESESNCETDKCDGFADDNYTFTTAKAENLYRLQKLLDEFEKLTGLGCNKAKTFVMIIGQMEPVPIPFKYTTELKMLGFCIRKNECLNVSNYDIVKSKIRKIINNWNRYGLTLSGKITVIKTLVLPHISFVGSVLEPPEGWVETISETIEKFVLGTEKFAKIKIYTSAEKGGLGLIPIREYILSQQCAWLKKAMLGTDDIWKYEIRTLTENFTKFFGHSEESGPVHTITRAAGNCLINHSVKFPLGAPIINNPAFWYGTNNNRLLFNDNFFEDLLGVHGGRKYGLKWKDLTDPENNLLTLEHMREFFGHRISTETYNKIRLGFNGAKRRASDVNSVESFEEAIKKRKVKGISRYLRSLFANDGKIIPLNKAQTKKFSETVNCMTVNDEVKKYWITAWTGQGVGTEHKNFLRKLYGNKLMVNARASHFRAETSPECTFCIIKKNLPAPKETIEHLFWYCPDVNSSIAASAEKIINGPVGKDFFFTGIGGNDKFCKAAIIFFDIVKYVIWEHKCQKKKPTKSNCEYRIKFLWESALFSNKKIKRIATNSDNFLPMQRLET
jgi:hypothetical protein